MMADSREVSPEDRLVRSRNRLILANAAAFGLWQLGDLLKDSSSGAAHAAFAALSMVGLLAWGTLLSVLMRSARRIIKDPRLRSIVEDERANDVRLRAYRLAFWGMLVVAAVLGMPAIARLLPMLASSRFVVVVGVCTFLAAFVVLDGKE